MLVSVLLKEKQFSISCGPATQPASWLAHVACLRYDSTLGQHLGPPVALCRADGEQIADWSLPLHSCVAHGEQLVVIVKGQQQQHEVGEDDYALVHAGSEQQQDNTERQLEEDEEEGEEEQEDELEYGAGRHESAADATLQSESSSDSEDDDK